MADGSGSFDIGGVINDGLRVLQAQMKPIGLLSLIFVGAPAAVLGLLLPTRITPAELAGRMPSMFGEIFIGALIAGLLGIVATAGIAYVAVNGLRGRNVDLGEALSKVGPAYLGVLGMTILIGIATGLGTLLLVVPGIFLALSWSVAVPARVMEPIGAIDAMSRSWRLVTGYRWQILGLVVIMIVVAFVGEIVVGIVSAIFALVGGRVIVSVLVSPLLSVVVAAVGGALMSAVYNRLVNLKEGGGYGAAEVFE